MTDKERLIEIIIKYGCPNCHIPKHKETLAEAILKEFVHKSERTFEVDYKKV